LSLSERYFIIISYILAGIIQIYVIVFQLYGDFFII
jgi:hypothetical protein